MTTLSLTKSYNDYFRTITNTSLDLLTRYTAGIRAMSIAGQLQDIQRLRNASIATGDVEIQLRKKLGI